MATRTRSQRQMQRKYAHITAIVVGIFLALGGVFFITVVRGETDARNAKCTEKTTGTVTEVTASGSKYLNTIEYVAEDVECSTTANIKEDLGVGTQLDVYYKPLTVKHIYIEGISETGMNDVVTGLIMILAGAAFVATGIFMKKLKRSKTQQEE